jgi:diguanylate cyclase (GGDEF)-like protein
VLIFIDLDGFNSVNETLGFAMGDAALRHVADRLRDAAGPDCEVMRYAGDEFLIAIGDVDPAANLLQLANRYCECIAEPMPVSQVATLYLTASVGAAAFPDSGQTVLDLTRQADIATNRAKRNGRSGAFVFSNELSEALSDRLALGGRIRNALARDEFLLCYQPQIDAQDGSVVGLEALVRWDSPEFGLLPPGRFIPVAEDNGMIVQLGAWVLRTACRHLRDWIDMGMAGFEVSVNVSAAQMHRPNFVEEVSRIIAETGIDPGMLQLELTESVLIDQGEFAVAQMQQLRKLGVKIALDDFGVGYSSLSYLRRFPINRLKIDQSFIANITHDGKDAELVRAIISIGHHMGMRVVAEGVETLAQSSYLRRSHCDELQGFQFSQALPASSVPEMLRRRYQTCEVETQTDPERTLLLLDDEENILRSLIRLFRRDGYRVLSATNAHDAFELLARHPVQVVLSDQRMPGMSGTEFLSQVKALYPETIRIVLSGYTDLASVTDAINRGAIYKFLTKPWDDDALSAQVQDAFRRFEQNAESR